MTPAKISVSRITRSGSDSDKDVISTRTGLTAQLAASTAGFNEPTLTLTRTTPLSSSLAILKIPFRNRKAALGIFSLLRGLGHQDIVTPTELLWTPTPSASIFTGSLEVGEDIDRVNQFTSELIVEAVGKCIRVIDPGLGGALPTSLPPGMSARFRVGMSLAQACQVNSVSRLEHITPSGQGRPTISL
ncbi:hypothetical protein GOODEAATRI_004417 [Goodea atripinnis]|uniref:CCDC22 N-terminal domain-containing protein n=1 Tax=Goodea atripinnis TaxID=208336 RepID=A0ABV0PKU6_9TELE